MKNEYEPIILSGFPNHYNGAEGLTLRISANMDTSVRQRREPGQTPVSIPPLKETSIPSLFNSNHCALCLPETITIQSNTNYFPHSIRSGPSSQFRGASKGQKTKVLKILLLGIFAVKNDALAVHCHLCDLKLNFLTLLSCIYHLVSGA